MVGRIHMRRHFLSALLTSLAAYLCVCRGQLVVNVKNKGGETLVEKIMANTSADTVTLEYLNYDGSFITQFIDFKSVSLLSSSFLVSRLREHFNFT